jgi:hypothetical protein
MKRIEAAAAAAPAPVPTSRHRTQCTKEIEKQKNFNN